jgi:hypothetical protein
LSRNLKGMKMVFNTWKNYHPPAVNFPTFKA